MAQERNVDPPEGIAHNPRPARATARSTNV